MGSCTHIVDEKQILNQYEYDAWGNVVSQKETIKNRFKFNGQQLDPITQQYYLRARFYNPVVARFTQEDIYRGDGLNLYAYCDNNPVYYVDPSGNVICQKKADTLKSRLHNLSEIEQNELNDYIIDKVDNGKALDSIEEGIYKKLRLIPGTPGSVTGGSSKELGNNILRAMGANVSTNRGVYQAQHIIPRERRKHTVLIKIGMDLDHESNGIFLRTRSSGGISVTTRHQGSHPIYSEFIKNTLDSMDLSKPISQLEKEVYELQSKLRKLQEMGIPIYDKDNRSNHSQMNTYDLIERWFNKL